MASSVKTGYGRPADIEELIKQLEEIRLDEEISEIIDEAALLRVIESVKQEIQN